MTPCDAIVIGGGLSGSAVSIFLARAGRRVILFEKEAEAHHKVCGEFLSIEAQSHLTALGVDLDGLGAVPIDRFRLIRKRKVVESDLPFRAASLSRYRLDEALLALAEKSGAEVKRGQRVESLIRQGSGWQVSHASGVSSAPAIFLATGKHDLRGQTRRRGTQHDYIGLKQHFRLSENQRQAIAGQTELILFDGGYAGLQPIEGGVANLCLIVTKQFFSKAGKRWKSLLEEIAGDAPILAERLEGSAPCWDQPIAISGIPYGYVHRARADAPTGLFRLGDQIAVIPSFAGDGMAIALDTAFLAAASCLQGDPPDYHARVRQILTPQINFATLLSRLAAHPCTGRLMLSLFSVVPALLGTVISRTRIRRP